VLHAGLDNLADLAAIPAWIVTLLGVVAYFSVFLLWGVLKEVFIVLPLARHFAEVTEITGIIHEEAHEEANIILGVTFDESLGEALRVTVIATGINGETELDSLPDKVSTLPRTRKAPPPTLPFHQREGGPAEPRQPARKRNPFLDLGFDEDKLETPTFIRRNEN